MKHKSQGFTMIQAIVSIVILGLALTGASMMIGQSIDQAARNQKRITATYLGQECLELTRNLRDSSWKQGQLWDCAFPNEGLYRLWPSAPFASGQSGVNCQTDFGVMIEPLDARSADYFEKIKLFQSPAGFVHQGLHNRTGQNPTDFQRVLSVDGGGEEKSMTCEVIWAEERRNQSVSVRHILTNWKKQ